MTIRAGRYARRGRDIGVALDYSDASIEDAERLGRRLFAGLPGGLSDEVAEELRGRLVLELGAYFGQTFIRNHGGRWGWLTIGGRRVFALRTDSGFAAFPTSKAGRRLRGEEPDSLADLYRTLADWRPVPRL
jgi:hypothetical protein